MISLNIVDQLDEGPVDDDWLEWLNDIIKAFDLDENSRSIARKISYALDRFASTSQNIGLRDVALDCLNDLLIRLDERLALPHLSSSLNATPAHLLEMVINCLGCSRMPEYIPLLESYTSHRDQGISSSAQVAIHELRAGTSQAAFQAVIAEIDPKKMGPH